MTISWRIVLLSFGATATAYVVSFFGHSISLIGEVTAVALVCGYAILLWRMPVVALAVLCAELAATSFGRIFPVPWDAFLSVRSVMIVMTLVPSAISLFDQKTRQLLRPYFWPLLAIGAVLGWGILSGFLHKNPTSAIIGDVNGYLTFFLLPFVVRTLSVNHALRMVMSAAIGVILGLASLTILLYLFFLIPTTDAVLRDFVYRWVRDVRLGEITPRLGPPGSRRVFLQSQLWVVAGLLWFGLVTEWKQFRTRSAVVLAVIFFSALWVGMSRTFFVALGFTTVCTSVFLGRIRSGRRGGIRFGILLCGSAILAAALVYSISLGTWGRALETRFATITPLSDEPAIVSRWILLDRMNEVIWTAPLFGHGFGKVITYATADPRLLAELPDGQIGLLHTAAFEWGWHDFWVKMGLFGPLVFLWFLFAVVRTAWRKEPSIPTVWVVGLVVYIGIAHLFSPWLNHPVGIGLLVLAVGIQANTENKKTAT